ncbi:ATP-binding protein [Aeromicrobium sp. CF4.19]|uniref:ATP-binding protein n=1 Tax=Aeromicrobium sp. CF4.19 TaxID=3373082 RepID=UPI003EE75B09
MATDREPLDTAADALAPRARVRLPFHPSTPSIARTKLAAFLTVHRAEPSVIDDALIVVSEMIANAISHGEPDSDETVEITWSLDRSRHLLELSVHDAGEGATLDPIDFDEDSLSGRGLSIISRVADRWWVDMSSGTRVNAELALSEH